MGELLVKLVAMMNEQPIQMAIIIVIVIFTVLFLINQIINFFRRF